MTTTPIQNCGKCGLCLNACPVYKILKEEQVTPRAKLQLIKAYENKTLASSDLLKEIVSKCLMCGSCSAACPSGINHYSKFMDMRKKMVAELGETPAIKSMIYLLGREHRLKFGVKLARTGQKIIPKSFSEKYKLGNIPLKKLPELNKKPFRSIVETISLPDKNQTNKNQTGSIVYFTGCATNYLYEDTGKAVVDILNHMGFKVIIPKGQTCCSIPLLFHGAQDMAAQNIKTNVKELKDHDADAIIVDCSTCGEALRNEYPEFFQGSAQLLSDAEKIGSKVVDALTFIETNFDLLEFDESVADQKSATYHAPCHTKNNAGSHLIVERLIEKLPFISYKRAVDFDECCGGGGTFFYEYPEISKNMMEKKIQSVKQLGTDYWLTDCPVCRMNLSGNLDNEENLEVLHPITLIQRALKK